jgi:hypothetical protein
MNGLHGMMHAGVASSSPIQTGVRFLDVDSNCDRKTTKTGRQLSSSSPGKVWLQKRGSQALSQLLRPEMPTRVYVACAAEPHLRPLADIKQYRSP